MLAAALPRAGGGCDASGAALPAAGSVGACEELAAVAPAAPERSFLAAGGAVAAAVERCIWSGVGCSDSVSLSKQKAAGSEQSATAAGDESSALIWRVSAESVQPGGLEATAASETLAIPRGCACADTVRLADRTTALAAGGNVCSCCALAHLGVPTTCTIALSQPEKSGSPEGYETGCVADRPLVLAQLGAPAPVQSRFAQKRVQ